MTTSRHDMAFGRQGGRIVDYVDTFDVDDFPRCLTCGQPMVVGQRGRHFLCDPASIVGRSCSCASGCTDKVVGDAGRCDPACLSCRVLAGRTYDEIVEFRRNRKPVAEGDAGEVTEATELADQLSIFGGVA